MSDDELKEHWNCEALISLPDGGNAGVVRYLFTYAILCDLTETGYGQRWCYHDRATACAALYEWLGHFGTMTEPTGWHRHLPSGRRRDKEGVETVNW